LTTNDWPFGADCRNIRDVKGEYRATRIYQWLSSRASSFRSVASGRGTIRTVRTEVTEERQRLILLAGRATAGFDLCPFCGQKLAPATVESTQGHLSEGSISPEPAPVDRPPPRLAGGSSTK
jgi:hypothetical protein